MGDKPPDRLGNTGGPPQSGGLPFLGLCRLQPELDQSADGLIVRGQTLVVAKLCDLPGLLIREADKLFDREGNIRDHMPNI
jgi:hypothetical protein